MGSLIVEPLKYTWKYEIPSWGNFMPIHRHNWSWKMWKRSLSVILRQNKRLWSFWIIGDWLISTLSHQKTQMLTILMKVRRRELLFLISCINSRQCSHAPALFPRKWKYQHQLQCHIFFRNLPLLKNWLVPWGLLLSTTVTLVQLIAHASVTIARSRLVSFLVH